MKVTAIMVDGGFYHKRAQYLFGKESARDRAYRLVKYCQEHLKDANEQRELYRIFYYDCPPLEKNMYHPFLKKNINLKKTDTYTWMIDFLNELRHMRKLALRLGMLAESQVNYNLRPEVLKALCRGNRKFEDLTEDDFDLDVIQKGVDMKIGLDISSLAYKKIANQIILISGDSDFVPAAKLARREGMDFILDSMGAQVRPDLYEHIDGLKTHVTSSKFSKPVSKEYQPT